MTHPPENKAKKMLKAGELVLCWRCQDPHQPITGRQWHLGHDDHDRTITRGPEHERCNLSAAGHASHG